MQAEGCLADISGWMKEHHLQLNLADTELLVFPATPTLLHDFTIQIDSSTTTPSSSVRNLGVIFDDQLTFQRPRCKNSSISQVCIAQHQKDQALPYTACSTTSCPCLVFSELKRANVTPLFVSLHCLPVATCIKFKTLMLAYRTAKGSAPSYLHSLMTIYIPSRSLRSVSERCLVVPSQRGTKSLSRTFSFTVPGWWNELPTPI